MLNKEQVEKLLTTSKMFGYCSFVKNGNKRRVIFEYIIVDREVLDILGYTRQKLFELFLNSSISTSITEVCPVGLKYLNLDSLSKKFGLLNSTNIKKSKNRKDLYFIYRYSFEFEKIDKNKINSFKQNTIDKLSELQILLIDEYKNKTL